MSDIPRRPLAELSPELVEKLDRGDHLGMIIGLGEQLDEGWITARRALAEADRGAEGTPVDGVVVCGMGGSAIGGDLVGACLAELAVPYQVVRGYRLPGWASPATLVVAVSYSGNTEETLACAEAATIRGCRLVCVATGGRLADLAATAGSPLVPVPGGLQPRAAVGYLVAAIAAILDDWALGGGFAEQVAAAAHLLCNMATVLDVEVAESVNAAKAIAARLYGCLPLVYGAGLTVPAARRWKCEINENAKAPAFWAEVPELDHNEVAGWPSLPELGSSVVVVALDDPLGDPRLARRMDVTLEALAPHVADVVRVAARGEAPLARVFSSAYLGDAVSYYLALLYGVDPSPVTAIEALKLRLAGGDDGTS